MDLDMDLEPLRRREDATADDSGDINSSVRSGGSRDHLMSARTGSTSDDILPPSEPEPEVVAESWNDADWEDDDWDDDEDWGNEDLAPQDPVRELKASQDKAHLVDEIREAMTSVSHVKPDEPAGAADKDDFAFTNRWAEDDEFGRRAIARSQLTGNASEDRILQKTETVMTDRETSRRRSAMAHLKAAAAATKADRVLKHVVSRDLSADPEEQSPYRDDLAKVVRPHRPTSRPISRVVSHPVSQQAIWDQGEGDEDAALYAASTEEHLTDSSIEAELAAAEAERLARAPIDLTEEDFADDSIFQSKGSGVLDEPETEAEAEDDGFPNSPFAAGNVDDDDVSNAFDASEDFDEDSYEDNLGDVDDDFKPRPSSVVSEAVAFANATEDTIEEPDEAEVRKKIWEMADEVAPEVEHSSPRQAEPVLSGAPVVAGRAGRSAGRVKTRMLGFQPEAHAPKDVFEDTAEKVAGTQATHFPAGWIVVVAGPGRGASFTLHNGVSQIGRGEDQVVRLDFGDTSISRNNHAAVAYDDEQGKFFLGHGGKSNLVRLNGRPVLSTEEMANGDQIRIGETTLKFVSLCSEEFTWKSTEGTDSSNV